MLVTGRIARFAGGMWDGRGQTIRGKSFPVSASEIHANFRLKPRRRAQDAGLTASANLRMMNKLAHHARPSAAQRDGKSPQRGRFRSPLLPPRSTAGQLTLDQHIGVRIPGGQPNSPEKIHPSGGPTAGSSPPCAVSCAVKFLRRRGCARSRSEPCALSAARFPVD